ncbi:MAG: hypothetical protein ACYS0K_16695, partial [Planctomycetota bacterium]
EAEPAPAAPLETATDLPGEPKIALPAAAEPDAAATEAEPAPAAPLETATDVAGEPGIKGPAGTESDATATEVDPSAFEAASADDIADDLEFVGFDRPAPKVDAGATETDLGSSSEDDLDVASPVADTEATATDVGELSALEAAVADLAAQVGADPLHEEADAEATATDVAGLAALKEAVADLTEEVDAGGLDEEADDRADEETEEEPQDITHSQLDIVRRRLGKRPAAEPSDETEAD